MMFAITWNHEALAPVVWTCLAALTGVGLLALVSPARFSALTSASSKWVDTKEVLDKLDKRVDVDSYILPFSRALGAAVLASVGIMAFLYMKYFSG